MKEYPSIKGATQALDLPCIAFDKLDGSNLRWEWNKKQGWHKFGTRTQLFDESNLVFGPAISIFKNTLADGISKVIQDDKQWRNCQRVTVFTEFLGPTSFAGQHELVLPNDPKEVVLFDVWLYKYGLIGPREFVKSFGHLRTPAVVYEGPLNATFIEDVRDGKYPVNEGVIAKGMTGGHKDLWMRKIKTRAYLERLKTVFGAGWEKFGE